MSIKIEAVTPKVVIGEGPFWDANSQCLYFVDVFGKYINKYSPSTNAYSKASVPTKENSTISSVIPVEGQDDQFIICAGKELIKIQWDGVSEETHKLETLVEMETKNFKWNDARVDFSGRLWIGSFIVDVSTGGFIVSENEGVLYVVESNGALKQHLDGISMPNGLDWNKARDSFYLVDSLANEILKFDYDANTDKITNKQVVFQPSAHGIGGIPDGSAIDENDNLWIATFGGGQIVNIDPSKPNTIIRTIDMPVMDITSVAFGGPNLDELYVTSPSVAPMENFKELDGGYLYKITGLGVRGFPGRKVKLN